MLAYIGSHKETINLPIVSQNGSGFELDLALSNFTFFSRYAFYFPLWKICYSRRFQKFVKDYVEVQRGHVEQFLPIYEFSFQGKHLSFICQYKSFQTDFSNLFLVESHLRAKTN